MVSKKVCFAGGHFSSASDVDPKRFLRKSYSSKKCSDPELRDKCALTPNFLENKKAARGLLSFERSNNRDQRPL
jgi:hypothetical protein